MMTDQQISTAILKLNSEISSAEGNFLHWSETGDEYSEPSWEIQMCYLQLLAIAESMQLEEYRKLIFAEYEKTKSSKNGFLDGDRTPDGVLYSTVTSMLRKLLRPIEAFYPEDNSTKVTKDLLDIIRNIHYVITDSTLYGAPPKDENDVHIRIEGILKCVFSSLKHKPTLTKAIKNFEPDTGIDVISTLIEYKFLSSKNDVGPIADQVLADTRGYVSKDWRRFLYVIYETNRFRTEAEWNQLLRQSGVSENTSIVVLSGEPAPSKKSKD
jgi:hypothetical protein